MKRSTQVVCVVIAVVTLLQFTSTNGHITLPGHFGVGTTGILSPHQLPLLPPSPLSSLHSYHRPQTPTVPSGGPNLLLATKIVAIMTFLADNPKILCITPPFIVADILGRLSKSALIGVVPHDVIYKFVSSVYAVPNLSSAIPSDVYASLIHALSSATPAAPGVVQASSDTTVAAAAATPAAAYPGSPSPGVVASGQKTLAVTPTNCAPPSAPDTALPGIVASSQNMVAVTPTGSSALPNVVASSQKNVAVTPTGSSALPDVVASSQKNVAVTPTGSSALPDVVATSQKELTVTPTNSALPGIAATSQTAVGILPTGGGAYPGGSAPPGVAATSQAAASVVPTADPSQAAVASPPSAVTAIAQTTLAQGGPGSAGMNVALLISLLQKGVANMSPQPCGLVGGAHNKGCSGAVVKKPINPFKITDVLLPSKPPTIALPPPPPRVKPQLPDKFDHAKIHQLLSNLFAKPADKSKPTLNHPPLLSPKAPCPPNGIPN